MPRKTANNQELWKRRRTMFEEWCGGTSVMELSRRYKLDKEAVKKDIAATIQLLKDFDGLERIGKIRQRMLAQLWAEVEQAMSAEMSCLAGLDASEVLKTGEIVKVKVVDPRAAAQYQANRLKALQTIQRVMRLDASAPKEDDDQTARTWADLIRIAHQSGKGDQLGGS